jgi:hypothetical protein
VSTWMPTISPLAGLRTFRPALAPSAIVVATPAENPVSVSLRRASW